MHMQPCKSISLTACFILLVKVSAARESASFFENSSVCAEDSITDVNSLGFQLLNKLLAQQGNIFLSPVGIGFNLGILYSAATNETFKQIESVLLREGSDSTVQKVEDELNQLLDSLKGNDRNFTIVNEIFFEDCKYINEEYVKTLKDNFVDEVKMLHYSGDLKEDSNSTNTTDDVSANTLKTDKPIIKVLSSLTFNDSWKVQFLAERTQRDYFYSGKRETLEVWMMSIEAENFKFYEDLEMKYKFIELPYESDMSMILALPTQYDQPANLQLDKEKYCEIKSKLIPTKLDMVSIPKLHFDEEVSIKKELILLGVEDAFNESTAEFPGLSDDAGFHVSDVKQKINLEVDEDGSEAASITKLKFKPVAFRGVKEFIANHPFMFYVEDKKTGTILLSGRVDEPSESESFTEKLRF